MSENKEAIFDESGGKFLTFICGDREYGIQIMEAREVVKMMEIDPVPQTPDFMKGIINLRGRIIPVIDLRQKFNLREYEKTAESCILVTDIKGKLTGAVIDQLVGVVTIEEKEFEESPDLGANINTEFIRGIAKLEKRVIIILNMKKVLSNEELIEPRQEKAS
ncbi:MAG: chemotaxis protein CheW [Deltaproteobacteria bacterium]|nr:chemotaxis protein CheW [Deltaproteobacteria bacterium]